MFKRAVCLGLAITIVFSVCCRQVKAEEIVEENEETVKTVDEMIESYDEEMAKIRDMYKNLEFVLPDEEYVWKEKENVSVCNLSRTITSLGIYTTGSSTGTAIIEDMLAACSRSYSYERSGIIGSFQFGTVLKDTIVVPGMKNTNVKGESCVDMAPQGITYYDGYYFITAYCFKEEHNSVIYVIDGSTKKYITTLVVANKKNGKPPHVGSITYANNYLWLGASDKIHYYCYDEIVDAIEYAESHSNVKSIYIGNCTWGEMSISSGGYASFLTTYNGLLCLGKCSDDEDIYGTIGYYYPEVTESGTLGCVAIGEIPPYAQGIDFYVTSNDTYIILTASWGYLYSEVYVYKKSGTSMAGDWVTKKIINFPCKVEQVVINGNKTYFVFESCAKAYRTLSNPVIGAACGFNTNFILK